MRALLLLAALGLLTAAAPAAASDYMLPVLLKDADLAAPEPADAPAAPRAGVMAPAANPAVLGLALLLAALGVVGALGLLWRLDRRPGFEIVE